ncbi:MAG: hypothetical protein ACT4N2_07790 [Hyphomicrobium sp.]
MTTRLLLFAITVLAGTLSATSAERGSRIAFELADRAGLDRIEIEVSDPATLRPERRAISDLRLDAWTATDDLVAILKLPNGQPPQAGRELFAVQVVAVSGGRLHTRARASCGPWEGDVSVCSLDCDGGRFALRRSPRMAPTALRLMIGVLPRDIDIGEKPGFALSGCGLDATTEWRVVPKPGRPLVELQVIAESGER